MLTLVCVQAQGQKPPSSPAIALEEAIYTEQTLGELERAADLYQSLFEQQQGNRDIAVEAMTRWIQCQVKLGNVTQARTKYIQLKGDYPEAERWIKAAEHALGLEHFSANDLVPVPWQDGEALLYHRLVVSSQLYSYAVQTKKRHQGATPSKENAWETTTSMFIVGNLHQEYWHYVADSKTNYLLESRVDTLHHKGKRFVRNGSSITVTDFDQGTEYQLDRSDGVYDSGLIQDILRRLPQKVGYRTSVPLEQGVLAAIRVVETGVALDVPAGQFEVTHLKIEFLANGAPAAYADAWVSEGHSRYLVKYQQGDLVEILQEILPDITQPRVFKDAKGFSMRLPPKWFAFYVRPTSPKHSDTHLQPLKAYETSVEIKTLQRHDIDWEALHMREVVKELGTWDYSWLRSYQLDKDSIEYFTLNGQRAVSLGADVVFNTEPMMYYRVVVARKPDFVMFTFLTHKDKFDERKPEYDRLINSVEFY